MSERENKRKRVADLLRAGIAPKVAATTVGVSKVTAYDVKKSIDQGKSLDRKPGSGGHNKIRSQDLVEEVRDKISEDPTTSMTQMAKELEVSDRTVRRVVHEDLGMHSFVRTQRHLLTTAMKARRLERCKKVLAYIKANGNTVRIFSDKKIFTVDAVYNRRNDRFIAKSIEEVQGVFRTKHPQKVMVLGVVASDGKKMPPYFFKPNEKVGADVYYKVLRYNILPWLKANYPAGNYVWTQDGAPAHTSKKAQVFCQVNMADYWPSDMWPSSSPDLNPLDFAVWGVLERKANHTPHPNVDSLKVAIKAEWDNLSEDFIVKSCGAFRRRIEAVIGENGGHIE